MEFKGRQQPNQIQNQSMNKTNDLSTREISNIKNMILLTIVINYNSIKMFSKFGELQKGTNLSPS